MKNIIFVVLFSSALLACSTSKIDRNTPDSIASKKQNKFESSKSLEITSCVTKNFKRIPQSIMHNHLTTQSISTEGHEIDLLGTLGGTLMIGVDVNNNGTSIIYISKYGEKPALMGSIYEQKQLAIKIYEDCLNNNK